MPPCGGVYYTGRRGRSRAGARHAAAALIALGLLAPACPAQTEPGFTLDPVMIRGPATAPVTIVEFSDYQ